MRERQSRRISSENSEGKLLRQAKTASLEDGRKKKQKELTPKKLLDGIRNRVRAGGKT